MTGKCKISCSPGLGRSLVNGKCQPCSDQNCLDCSDDVAKCKRCNLLYALENNACVSIFYVI